MKITSFRCRRCGTPLAIIGKDGKRTCAKCGRDPELSREEIEAARKRQEPSVN